MGSDVLANVPCFRWICAKDAGQSIVTMGPLFDIYSNVRPDYRAREHLFVKRAEDDADMKDYLNQCEVNLKLPPVARMWIAQVKRLMRVGQQSSLL